MTKRARKPAAAASGRALDLDPLSRREQARRPFRVIQLGLDSEPARYTHLGKVFAGVEGFRSARVIRNEGRAGVGAAASKHTKLDRKTIIAEARRFDRDNALYQSMLDRATDYIVGSGWDLQPLTKSKNWNRQAEALWDSWGQAPEVRDLFSWADLEDLACREFLNVGDFGAVKLGKADVDAGRLQLFEAELIDSSDRSYTEGIRLSPRGKPEAFHVGRYDANGFLKAGSADVTPYTAEQFIFCSRLNRFSAVRGYPALTSAFPMFHRIDDTCDSEAAAWQTISRLAVAITRKGADDAYGTSRADDKNSGSADGDLSRRVVDIDKALMFFGEQGDEVKSIDHNVPGANFERSLVMFLRILGLPLGMPLELVLLDWSKTNYASARAALEQAYRVFTNVQRRLAQSWHAQVYRWKVDGWVASGELAERPDKYRHQWVAPSFPWIDQLKEAQGWGAKLDRGLVTHASACKSLNVDRQQFLLDRSAEVTEAIAAAKAIQDANPGVKVPWEIFCGLRPGNSPDAKVPETSPREPRTPADDAGAGDEPLPPEE